MRLAFVSTLAATPWGGSEELWTTTAARALAAGHEVLLMTYRWPSRHPRIDALHAQGAKLDERSADRRSRRSWFRNQLHNPFQVLRDYAPRVVLVNQAGTYDISQGGEDTALRRTLERHALPYILLCHCEQDRPPVRRVRRARSAFAAAAITGFLGERLRQVTESHLDIALPSGRVFQNPLRFDGPGALPWPAASPASPAWPTRIR